MTGLAPLPESKATTSYELLNEVLEAIREEPTRFKMDDIVTAYQNKYQCPIQSIAPACGTVGCYAGWVGFLTGRAWINSFTTRGAAQLLAGKKSSALCTDLWLLFNTSPFNHVTYGTPEYAEKAISVLQEFINAHAPELKAVMLPPMETT